MTSRPFGNAPLIEMIAELRWDLHPVTSVPGGGIDPFYEATKAGMASALAAEVGGGWNPTIEEIVPLEIPREFLAGQITTRYRKAAGDWPLVQLGPGICAINMTSSYEGWDTFRPWLVHGVSALLKAHPVPSALKFKSLNLLAVDAFGPSHGYVDYQDFATRLLNLGNILGSDYLAKFSSEPNQALVQSQTVFPLRSPEGASGRISIAEGERDKEKALLVQTAIEHAKEFRPEADHLLEWFDSAHAVHREMFRAMLTSDLTTLLHTRT
ncbi:TIGR04255 family protein [Achromobacter spanius]|uniref:TIGR04255 family protein n=1 Tax=Achromobacter spanius TaxID=217203 RepID=UPI003A8DD141